MGVIRFKEKDGGRRQKEKKESKKVVSQDQWVVSFCPSVPDSNGGPHAATPPSHHQSSAGWGAAGMCVCLCARVFECVCISRTPPGETSSRVCHSEPFFFFSLLLPKWVSIMHMRRNRSLRVTYTHTRAPMCTYTHTWRENTQTEQATCSHSLSHNLCKDRERQSIQYKSTSCTFSLVL